ncbi:MAG: amidohydrolase, partial [Chloroflexi bacterium]|nr:amidohydrolase [Chloroflexota bacterium]
MLKGYRIIDVDGHVQEPADLWEKWIEPEFKDDAPTLVDGRRFYRGQESSYKLSAS